jgi:hypothetical protein
VNVQTKEKTQQWTQTYSSNKPRMFKEMSACQKPSGNSFQGQEGSADDGIHATRNNKNVRIVLRAKH